MRIDARLARIGVFGMALLAGGCGNDLSGAGLFTGSRNDGSASASGMHNPGTGGSTNGTARDSSLEAEPTDALACQPAAVGGLNTTWAPPAAPTSVCTQVQLQSLYAACEQGTVQTCRSFETDPANAACAQCVYTVEGDARFGPVVTLSSGERWANVGGCIALTDGDDSATGCGAKYFASEKCADVACNGCVGQDRTDCTSAAQHTVCSAYVEAAVCALRPASAGCIASSFEEAFLALGTIFCAAPSDGGAAPDGSTSDESTGDESTRDVSTRDVSASDASADGTADGIEGPDSSRNPDDAEDALDVMEAQPLRDASRLGDAADLDVPAAP
jgi:hypothetical protein